MLQRIRNQEWFEGLLDFVFPPLCLGCGEFNEDLSKICPKCLGQIEPFEYPLCLNCRSFVPKGIVCPVCTDKTTLLFAYANYQPPLKDIIIQFKFRGITSPAKTFAELTNQKYESSMKKLQADALIPIPLHPSRFSFRGYNQAELFADELSKLSGLPVMADVLYRIKRGRPQARLEFKKRIANIHEAYKVKDFDNKARQIILVDDVVTSGATVLEAKKCLENADYKVVAIISIAHGV